MDSAAIDLANGIPIETGSGPNSLAKMRSG